ncbi:MAG TPA: hypothetical protein VGN90_08530 [Pyrinomonadaceae bacterium]|nr:hypothetical protein [Pyrinomonadaceae bacterium]
MTFLNRAVCILIASICLLPTPTLVSARNVQDDPRSRNEAAKPSPNEVLRSAQTIFIRSNSVYFKAETLENSLLQQDEFQQWGLVITRDENDADLIIEVGRKLFTSSFIYSVIDPRNKRVVASGRVNSIGGTVEGKITESFMKKLRTVRQPPASNQTNHLG